MTGKKQSKEMPGSTKDNPRELTWSERLWRLRWPIFTIACMVGFGIAVTVATSGVGALTVAPVAIAGVAHYSPSAAAAISMAAISGTVLLGFAVNKAIKSSKDESLNNDEKPLLHRIFKEIFGTGDTRNPKKLLVKNLKARNMPVDDEEAIDKLLKNVLKQNQNQGNIEYVNKNINGVPCSSPQIKNVKKFGYTVDEAVKQSM